jgi:hypothetical protein
MTICQVWIYVQKDRLVLEAIDLAAEDAAAVQAYIHAEQELALERAGIGVTSNAWCDALWPHRVAAPAHDQIRVGDRPVVGV